MLRGAIKGNFFLSFLFWYLRQTPTQRSKIKNISSQVPPWQAWSDIMSDIIFFSVWEPSFPFHFHDHHGYRPYHWRSLMLPIHWFHLDPCHSSATDMITPYPIHSRSLLSSGLWFALPQTVSYWEAAGTIYLGISSGLSLMSLPLETPNGL